MPSDATPSRSRAPGAGPSAGDRAPRWIADRLDVRLAQRRVGRTQLEALADALVALHEAPASGSETPSPEALAARAAAARRAIAVAAPELEDAAAACEAAVRRAGALAARAASPGPRRLHGALRCDAIHADPHGVATLGTPRPEAAGDPCEDVAALAVELAAREQAEAAVQLVAAYVTRAGDFALYRVLDAHLALAALAAAQAALAADPGNAPALARRLLAAPAACAPAEAAFVLATAGGVASGKSTLARRLSALTGAPVAEADAARAAGLETLAAGASEDAYTEMLQGAGDVLAAGRPVVVDACFATRAQRAALRALADRHGAPLLLVECRADAAEVRRRLQVRAEREGCADAAWLALRDRVAAAWEPVRELRREQHLVVDTAGDLEAELPRVARALARWRPRPHRVRRVEPPGVPAFA